MKNLKLKNLLSFFSMTLIMLVLFSSCEDESTSSTSGPLAITSVAKSEAGELTPVVKGDPNNYYIIRGSGFLSTQKIYFNDFDTYFNPTLITDTEIVVLIDEKTPYVNASNKLKLVTKSGTILYDFIISPPVPSIDSFNSINAAAGDEVTIYGNYFINPVVSVGTENIPLTNFTLTEIKFKMPANATDKYISVTNISGTTIASDAIGSALYDDILQGETGHNTWSGTDTFDTNFATDKVQGLKSIKFIFGGWNGCDMRFTSRNVSKYKAFRVRVKSISTNADASIKFVFGGWAYQIIRPFSTEWTTIEIPFSEIGNPTTFDQLTLQESGNFGGNTILFDNMGFVLK